MSLSNQLSIDLKRFITLLLIALVWTNLALNVHAAGRQVLSIDQNWIMDNHSGLGTDYIAFWSAGYLARTPHPEDVYDDDKLLQEGHKKAIPASDDVYAWFYPPILQMLMAPFSYLPYVLSWITFDLLSLAFFLTVCWLIRPSGSSVLVPLSFGGVWLSLMCGQNGLFSAAVLGSGLLLLKKGRMPLAGMVLGFLIYKPQIALALPWAVVAQKKYYPAILTAGFMIAVLTALSVFVLGTQVWAVFFASTRRLTDILSLGQLPISHMISTYSALWQAGLSPSLSLLFQALCAAFAALSVFAMWRRKNISFNDKAAALTLAVLLTSPHLFQYELPIFALALMFLWLEGEQRGWSVFERTTYFILYAGLPLIPYYYDPVVFILLMLFLLWRSRRDATLVTSVDMLNKSC